MELEPMILFRLLRPLPRWPGGPSGGAALLAISLSLAGGCASAPGGQALADPPEGILRVRLVAAGSAVPGARVRALRSPGVEFSEREFTAVAGEGDEARLLLSPGFYYVTALSPDGSIFGYYGPNPVQVRPGEESAVAVRGLEGNTPPRPAPAPGPGGVEGRVVTEEGPLAGATVAFYLDASSQFRGPAYVEVASDGRGRFAAPVSPGRYYLVVRRRDGAGESVGPLAVGDHFGYYGFNPLYLSEGERTEVQIGAVEVLRRAGWKRPSTLRTRLSGRVVDSAGRPLEGYRVFLHSRPEMLGQAAFVSAGSGPDGGWELWAEREGTFYLGARSEVGVARRKGERVGFYEGTADHSVVVTMDGKEMTGLDVVVGEER